MRSNKKNGLSKDDVIRTKVSRLDSLTEQEEAKRQRQILDLYDEHRPRLFRYLRTLGLSRDQIDDVIQETFLRLSSHLADVEESQGSGEGKNVNLRSWIFQVAYNLSMDTHRAINRDKTHTEPVSDLLEEPIDPDADPERTLMERETLKRVQALMKHLTPQQRNSVLLRARGLLFIEIAAVLKVSESRAVRLVKRGTERIVEGL